MRAGELRHRVAVLERSYATTDDAHAASLDEYGERKAGWQTAEKGQKQRWASITPLTGRELFEARQVHSEVTHRVTLRGVDLSPGARIKFGTREFEVVSVLDASHERGIATVAMCRERVANG